MTNVKNKFFLQQSDEEEQVLFFERSNAMEQRLEKSKAQILEILGSLPQPGKVLLKSIGDGLAGFCLRPKSIPQKLTGADGSYAVALQILRKEKVFSDKCSLALDIRSNEWCEWISKKPAFVILSSDVGKEINITEERYKNFNKNLLHEFLDQITITLSISADYHQSILNPDSYTHYFWDNAVSVSGTSSTSEIQKIKLKIKGIKSHSAIKSDYDDFYLNYWEFLPEEKRLAMKIIIKWHKALIALLHLMKCDNVFIPLDFTELKKNCWDEISATS